MVSIESKRKQSNIIDWIVVFMSCSFSLSLYKYYTTAQSKKDETNNKLKKTRNEIHKKAKKQLSVVILRLKEYYTNGWPTYFCFSFSSSLCFSYAMRIILVLLLVLFLLLFVIFRMFCSSLLYKFLLCVVVFFLFFSAVLFIAIVRNILHVSHVYLHSTIF